MRDISDELYQLINLLTPGDKEFFRKFILLKKHYKHISTTTLLDLFDAFCKMKTYDETKLKRKFHNLKGNSFSSCKSVLKECIQYSLLVSGLHDNPFIKRLKELMAAEVLAAVNLKQPALKLLNNERADIGQDPDFNFMQPELIALQKKKDIIIPKPELLEFIESQRLVISETVYMNNKLRHSVAMLDRIACTKLLQNQEGDEKELYDVYRHYFADSKNLRTKQPIYYRQKGRITYALLTCDFDEYLRSSLQLWQHYNQPNLLNFYLTQQPAFYNDVFIHTVRACILTKNAAELSNTIKLAKSPIINPQSPIIKPVYFSHANLMLACLQNDSAQMQQQITLLEQQSVPGNDPEDYRCFLTSLSLAHYQLKNYNTALQYTFKIIDTKPSELSGIHYRCFCVLFRFLTEYEMLRNKTSTDRTGFERMLLGTINILNKQHHSKAGNKNRSYELAFLRFLKALMEKNKIAAAKYLEEIKSFSVMNSAKHYNVLFPITAWAESRLN